MSTTRRTSGHRQLPYRMLAGVVPHPKGWLAMTGKLHGINVVSDGAVLFAHIAEILEHRPTFDIVGLHSPIGLPAKATPGGRACDREAREVLGWPRAGAVMSAPPRTVLRARTFQGARRRHPTMSPVEWGQLAHIAELDDTIHPYHQRTVHEVHPELSFLQLNGEQPLRHSKHDPAGRAERRALLLPRVPGIGVHLDQPLRGTTMAQRLDAAAALWTARRIAARGVLRVPADGDWDERGLRMEMLR